MPALKPLFFARLEKGNVNTATPVHAGGASNSRHVLAHGTITASNEETYW